MIALLNFVRIIPKPRLRYTLIGAYTLACLWSFIALIEDTYEAGQCSTGLIESYVPFDEDKELFIVAIPDNYKGLYMFRDYTGDGISFKESLEWIGKKPTTNTFINILQYNQRRPDDVIKVDVIDSQTLHVGFPQIGNWWWIDGIGASDYENEHYIVELKSGYYKLTMKNPHPDQVFLYPVANKWQYKTWDSDK